METIVDTTRKSVQQSCTEARLHWQQTLDEVNVQLEALPTGPSTLLARRDLEERREACEEHLFRLDSGTAVRTFEQDARRFQSAVPGRRADHISRADTFDASKNKRKKTTNRNIVVEDNIGQLTATNGACDSVLETEFRERYCPAGSTLYMSVGNRCRQCQAVLCRMEGSMACEKCGITVAYVDCHSDTTLQDETMTDSHNFSYRRISHLCEWLACFQAKESVVIPDDVLLTIMENLRNTRNLKDPSAITPSIVRMVLKEEQLQKYYENSMLISCLLSGNKPPRLTPHEEMTLKKMFLSIQSVWDLHCPSDRKNFLSYSYTIYKMMELLGMDHYLPYFSLLKCKHKNARMDVVWRKICHSLDWQFIPCKE